MKTLKECVFLGSMRMAVCSSSVMLAKLPVSMSVMLISQPVQQGQDKAGVTWSEQKMCKGGKLGWQAVRR